MRRWIALGAVLLLLCSSVAVADQPVTVIVNGQAIQSDVPAQIIGGRTMVPLRFVAQALGANVSWDDATRTVTVMTRTVPTPPPALAPQPAQPSVIWQAPVVNPPGATVNSYAMNAPCTIGRWSGVCTIDTGTSSGVAVSAAIASAAGILLTGSTSVQTTAGSIIEPTGYASVSVGNSPADYSDVMVYPGTFSYPLIGLQFLIDSCQRGVVMVDMMAVAHAYPAIGCVQP